VLDAENILDKHTGMAEQELLTAERHTALHDAFTRLAPCCQQLIAPLIEDPPVAYTQISAKLGIPVGSIRPCNRRCLDKLRRDPAVAALLNTGTASTAPMRRQVSHAAKQAVQVQLPR
jgi:DNA-directed RNA polymerase specialized sigma24 family protein